METRLSSAPNLGQLRPSLANLDIGEVSLQEFGTPQDILIRFDQKNRSEKEQLLVLQKIKETLDPTWNIVALKP